MQGKKQKKNKKKKKKLKMIITSQISKKKIEVNSLYLNVLIQGLKEMTMKKKKIMK